MVNILVVENDLGNAEVIRFLLEDENYEVSNIHNGDLLATALELSPPDLIIMDIALGNHDGRKLCDWVKKDVKTKNIPILLLTALMESEATSVPCQANILMLKPYDMTCLLETVKDLLHKSY